MGVVEPLLCLIGTWKFSCEYAGSHYFYCCDPFGAKFFFNGVEWVSEGPPRTFSPWTHRSWSCPFALGIWLTSESPDWKWQRGQPCHDLSRVHLCVPIYPSGPSHSPLPELPLFPNSNASLVPILTELYYFQRSHKQTVWDYVNLYVATACRAIWFCWHLRTGGRLCCRDLGWDWGHTPHTWVGFNVSLSWQGWKLQILPRYMKKMQLV